MAFSGTTSLAVNNTNYIHDFASGAFTVIANLNLGYESFSTSSNSILGSISNDQYVGNTATNGSNSSSSEGYGILVDTSGGGTGLIANIPNLHGGILTKINWGDSSVAASFEGNLSGPYSLAYGSAGVKTPRFLLYKRRLGYWSGSFTPGLPFPQVPSVGQVLFSFEIFQRAVSVTKKNSGSGTTLVNGTSISNMDTSGNNVIILNKDNNRGDNILSTWLIKKQDSNGIFQTAVLGTDYSLVPGETLLSNQITLTWEDAGTYRVFNHSSGSVGISTGPNTDEDIINFTVGQTTVDTIILPTVIGVITPTVAPNNTVISLTPLKGVTNFSFTVNANIDVTNASWIKKVDTDAPVTLSLDLAAWTAELTSRCNIKCQAKIENTIVDNRIGLGPHLFHLPTGTYNVGYVLTPKSGNVLVTSFGGSIPVEDFTIG